jgi:predicted membrane channel-forming protein YqfA (hemolysin III family)
MLIGQDFEKIELELFGLIIQEPNGVISDLIMAIVSIVLGVLLLRKFGKSEFEKWWISFFFLYGISAFLGAFGHGFYHYFGALGKVPNWLTGIPIIYFIELAMISLLRDSKRKKTLKVLALSKMILVYLIFAWICFTMPIDEKPKLPFLPIAFNTIFGVTLSAGVLGYQFYRKEPSFKQLVIGVIIMIPSAFVFLMKINPTPWFDKNDISHLLLTIGIVFFYLGIRNVKNSGFLQLQPPSNRNFTN